MSVSKVKFADNLVTSRGIILPFLHFSKKKNNGPEMLYNHQLLFFSFQWLKGDSWRGTLCPLRFIFNLPTCLLPLQTLKSWCVVWKKLEGLWWSCPSFVIKESTLRSLYYFMHALGGIPSMFFHPLLIS